MEDVRRRRRPASACEFGRLAAAGHERFEAAAANLQRRRREQRLRAQLGRLRRRIDAALSRRAPSVK